MKLIELKCPNCHGSVKVNEELESAVCNYCGTKFKVEDENETESERIIKTQAKVDEKAKESERKYYASDDYKKKLETEAEINDKSILGKINKQINKSREYYSSDEYKKRLDIQNEQAKKSIKQLIPFLIGCFAFMILIPVIVGILDTSDKKDDMTCTIGETEYVIVMAKGEEVSCASCSEEMINDFNSKYLDKSSVTITKRNIRTYFKNNNGSCKG